MMGETVFWIAAVSVAPFWFSATLFPKAGFTKKLWLSPFAAIPWSLAFIFLVLPRLPWWLGLFVNPSLSLASLTQEFRSEDNFLLLWLYILCFDVVVFQDMYRKSIQQDKSAAEITIWALVTALCAPLGYGGFTLLNTLSSIVEDDEPEAKQIAKKQ